MSESVFLGASGELVGSAPEGGEEEEAAIGEEEEGRMGGGGLDCLVGVEHRAEVRMGTEERGSEGVGAMQEGGGLWWCEAREDIWENL